MLIIAGLDIETGGFTFQSVIGHNTPSSFDPNAAAGPETL
jgi:hypothetical protein